MGSIVAKAARSVARPAMQRSSLGAQQRSFASNSASLFASKEVANQAPKLPKKAVWIPSECPKEEAARLKQYKMRGWAFCGVGFTGSFLWPIFGSSNSVCTPFHLLFHS